MWTNPPLGVLKAEVTPHARFAVAQALAAPCLEVRRATATGLGGSTWRVELGLANTGWLPTYVSARAKKEELVRPIVAELGGEAIRVIGGPARQQLGQLEGRAALRFSSMSDGTPDRALVTWVVEAAAGAEVTVTATHQRAGAVTASIALTDAAAGA